MFQTLIYFFDLALSTCEYFYYYYFYKRRWPLCQPDWDILVCLCVAFFETMHCLRLCLFRRTWDLVWWPFVLSSQLHCSPGSYGLEVRKHSWCWFILFHPMTSEWRKLLLPRGFSGNIIMSHCCLMKCYETICTWGIVDLLKILTNQWNEINHGQLIKQESFIGSDMR